MEKLLDFERALSDDVVELWHIARECLEVVESTILRMTRICMPLRRLGNDGWVALQNTTYALARMALAESFNISPAVIVTAHTCRRGSDAPPGLRGLVGCGLGPWRRQRMDRPRRPWEESWIHLARETWCGGAEIGTRRVAAALVV